MNANSSNLQALQDRLRELLDATRLHTMRESNQGKRQALQDLHRQYQCAIPQEDQRAAPSNPNSEFSIVVVSRSLDASLSTHWAIAVVTNERSRHCRVFHVSDTHVMGLRALGWTAFVQDETLDRTSRYRGGVRIGFVRRDDLRRLEQTICGPGVPRPTSEMWDCEDWTLAVIRLLEAQGFALATAVLGADYGGVLINRLISDSLRAQRLTEERGSGPVFVQLSLLPEAGR
ncbi:hypothetical protein BD309DRAFT_1021141 [Dichomitus squalens]|uniref:Uncharacterized protein n=1 Tax=Dichomitus squalens TaxID=114155 RepID=A0A4Q9NJ40_9APHY|nr:hypothetical protein BD309DRAFT_1021141 [Dichomitus squalens]TBU54987.1 hypothetical protein BD310DRAFT_979933 [Dichomitus squalens]